MTNLERIFQRFYCLLGFLALAMVNASLYDRGPGLLTWEDRLGSWFVSGLFIAGGMFVGIVWAAAEAPSSDATRAQ